MRGGAGPGANGRVFGVTVLSVRYWYGFDAGWAGQAFCAPEIGGKGRESIGAVRFCC